MTSANAVLGRIAEAHEAERIELARRDPQVAALGLCPVCMCHAPCLCSDKTVLAEMRVFYEANRRTLFRAEPELIGSWGVKLDGLMTGLHRLATAPYEREIGKLRAELRALRGEE